MLNQQQIQDSITTLEAHRTTLGDQVTDASIQALRQALTLQQQDALQQATLKGERKIVTVVFADISGFTALSEKLDPEEVRSLINACFVELGQVIHRYDGYIDKFIGDEIMALFGAPVTHENDAERALRAALDMMTALQTFNKQYRQQLSQPLKLHLGINTGLVIAGGIGTNDRQDFSVMGDAVNLAARLEGISEAGEILVGPDTYRLTEPYFDFEVLPPVQVKGKADPVQIYRLLKATWIQGQIRGLNRLKSVLVGRQSELATLHKALTSPPKPQGCVVSLVGDAGIGKSRLIRELQDIPESEAICWAHGQALSYGQQASYRIIQDLLLNLLGIASEEDTLQRAHIVQQEIARLFADQASQIYPYLAHLLDIELTDESREKVIYLTGDALQERVLQAVEQYFIYKSAESPLSLIFDDLHWADPSSLQILQRLLPLTQHHALACYLLYRPMHDSRIWQFHQDLNASATAFNTVFVQVPPLALSESIELVENLMGGHTSTAEVRHLIVRRAEGNPFYIEEVIRSLLDKGCLFYADDDPECIMATGIAEITIPDTLQGVITARIDQLDFDAKRLLQIASVLGRTFDQEMLADVLQGLANASLVPPTTAQTDILPQLQNLQQLGLIKVKEEGLKREYAFQHVFSQESVYESLLRSDRVQIHQCIGEILEQKYEDNPADVILELAYHFESSLNKPAALKYLQMAAAKASDAFANAEARDLYQRALTFYDPDDPAEFLSRWQIQADLEVIYNRLGERDNQVTILDTMQAMADTMADPYYQAISQHRRANYFDRIADYQESAQAAETALHLAQLAQNKKLEAHSLNLLAQASWRRFDYDKVQTWANQALQSLQSDRNKAIRLTSLRHLGRSTYRLGQYDLALNYMKQALKLAHHIDNRFDEAQSYLILGWIYQRLGDYDLAQTQYQLNLDIRQTIGDRYGEAEALSHLGWLAFDQGLYQNGAAHCQTALAISRQIGDRENEAYALSGLGLALEGMESFTEAKEHYTQAQKIHSDIGAKTLFIFDLSRLAKIALTNHDLAEADNLTNQILNPDTYSEIARFWDPWLIYYVTYEVLKASHQDAKAQRVLQDAYQLLIERAARISDNALQLCFLEKVKVNKQIADLWAAN
ncbi:MAG: adenylate/guanylate cyclase domain-containing protein [Chloroflexota bacterium]